MENFQGICRKFPWLSGNAYTNSTNFVKFLGKNFIFAENYQKLKIKKTKKIEIRSDSEVIIIFK